MDRAPFGPFYENDFGATSGGPLFSRPLCFTAEIGNKIKHLFTARICRGGHTDKMIGPTCAPNNEGEERLSVLKSMLLLFVATILTAFSSELMVTAIAGVTKKAWALLRNKKSPQTQSFGPNAIEPTTLSGPLNRLNAILSLLHPLDRHRTLSTIGSAIGRPYLALSRIHAQVGVVHRLVLNHLRR